MNRLLCVVMDGVGASDRRFGNAVLLAKTPQLDALRETALYSTLQAHGTAVGLPSNDDIGNSEVGHNALGAGRIFDQGAKLVSKAIESEAVFAGRAWREALEFSKNGTLHLMGLLSDGNVHSHEKHLYALIRRAKKEGVKRVRVHALLDGRDVGEKSAEIYVARLEKVMQETGDATFDIKAASGGGRMNITMDRYEADWDMVKRGYETHVWGKALRSFASLSEAVRVMRDETGLSDQNLPAFVIEEAGVPTGRIVDGDSVIFFNFRGDRAIEISRALSEPDFSEFDRGRTPQIYFAGMMEYDGDLHIPKNYLVEPPVIGGTLSEYMLQHKARQFACSETQKFGHVTYFWNGNRSGYLDEAREEYLEITSDPASEFETKPAMKAKEIADATIERMKRGSFDFGRINFANGDMVGHTGNFKAAKRAMEVVDAQVARLVEAANETKTILVITADHGNCDEMFAGKEADYPNWESAPQEVPNPKTSHTLAPVPLYIVDPLGVTRDKALTSKTPRTLAHLANTMLELMDLPTNPLFLPSLLEPKL